MTTPWRAAMCVVAALFIGGQAKAQRDVPIGAVIDWWRPNANFPLPTGYMIADGSTVTDNRSPFNGIALPDLRNKFVRGANSLTDIGSTGGASQHSHSADPSAFTAAGDLHKHRWSYTTLGNNINWATWDAAGQPQLTAYWSNGIGEAGAGFYPFGLMVKRATDLYTEAAGGQFQLDVPAFTTANAGNEPPYVGLLKIIRVR